MHYSEKSNLHNTEHWQLWYNYSTCNSIRYRHSNVHTTASTSLIWHSTVTSQIQ